MAIQELSTEVRQGTWLNDVHAQLSATRVRRVVEARSVGAVQDAVVDAAREGASVCVGGGRHAMGGQPFATDGVHLDTRPLARVLDLDRDSATVLVEAGIQWPELMDELARRQMGERSALGIRQKQTGADRLCLGGALSANAHGRGLTMAPIVDDVEAFDLVDASGALVRCSRTENPELFRLAIGGYGLFGVIVRVRLRLASRRKLRRNVALVDTGELATAFEERIRAGYLYGDFQFAIDPASPDCLRRGVFACYEPVEDDTPVPAEQRKLSPEAWRRLVQLAHTRKTEAFECYAEHYLATDGQVYFSDTHQLATYLDGYHDSLDTCGTRGTEMITELYVPRPSLASLLDELREDVRRHRVDLVYGTVRLVERDTETVLAWAREPWACVVLNVHVEHTPDGVLSAQETFRRFIDAALGHGGSYYLTYHRWARRDQVLAAHPRMPEFLERKLAHDPEERFQSEWYREYRSR